MTCGGYLPTAYVGTVLYFVIDMWHLRSLSDAPHMRAGNYLSPSSTRKIGFCLAAHLHILKYQRLKMDSNRFRFYNTCYFLWLCFDIVTTSVVLQLKAWK